MKEKYALFECTLSALVNALKKKHIVVIIILLLHCITAKIGLSTAMKIQEMRFSANRFVIHPDGEISPVKRYIVRECDYTLNLVLCASLIADTYYEESSDDDLTTSKHIKNVKKYMCQYKIEYLDAFTSQLESLFCQVNGKLKLNSSVSDSVAMFMETYTGTSDIIYFLAALFLLSEGVRIDIDIVDGPENAKEKRLVLNKKGIDGEFYVNLSMHIWCKGEENSDAMLVYQKKTEQLLNFFKNTADPKFQPPPLEFRTPETDDEFNSGNFLFTPGFLIQSYFFEYIETLELYNLFVTSVYNLLFHELNYPEEKEEIIEVDDEEENEVENEWAGSGEGSSKTNINYWCIPDRIVGVFYMYEKESIDKFPKTTIKRMAQLAFDRLFLSEKWYLSKYVPKYINALCDIKRLWNNAYLMCPLLTNLDLPIYPPVPSFIRKKESIDAAGENYMERVLFDLFLCFTLNHFTKTHVIWRAPDHAPLLGGFFTIECTKEPFDYSKTLDLWCTDIKALLTRCVFYTEGKKQIEPGLLNMLYAIKGLTGVNNNLEIAILWLDSIIDKKRIDKSDQKIIQYNLQNVFKSLSENKSIKVECRDIKLRKTKSGRLDLFTDDNSPIVVIYNERPFNSYRLLEIEIPHITSTFVLRPITSENSVSIVDQIKTKLELMQTNDYTACVYTNCIIKQYINNQLDKLAYAYRREYTYTDKIKSALDCGYKISNGFLVWGSVCDPEYTSKIIEMFLMHSSAEILDDTNPMVQFTSIFVKRLSIINPETLPVIMCGCVYNENYKAYYSQLERDSSEMLSPYNGLVGAMHMACVLFNSNLCPATFVHGFASMVGVLESKLHTSRKKFVFFTQMNICKNIIKKVSNDSKSTESEMESNIETILSAIEDSICDYEKYTSDNIFMCWIFYIACGDLAPPIVVIKAIYNYISYEYLTPDVKKAFTHIWNDSIATYTLDMLSSIRLKLLNGKGNENSKTVKYKEIIKFISGLKNPSNNAISSDSE
ncbi:hypothetical protein NEIG_02381 [Nematocida sp. ERTm5]|nr:hypothetical protein NEIG_02175 [Nematocida sp. ERTm5]OAG33201.1 hypothetical protein NEIG_01626 [Nematocida sp. ERTm5]OAG33690.1 hypothetical protein NEIG_02381 [Nematocida sp. ERTm5]